MTLRGRHARFLRVDDSLPMHCRAIGQLVARRRLADDEITDHLVVQTRRVERLDRVLRAADETCRRLMFRVTDSENVHEASSRRISE